MGYLIRGKETVETLTHPYIRTCNIHVRYLQIKLWEGWVCGHGNSGIGVEAGC